MERDISGDPLIILDSMPDMLPSGAAVYLFENRASINSAVLVLRRRFGISVPEAYNILLENHSWRDYILEQANKSRACKRRASRSIRAFEGQVNLEIINDEIAYRIFSS